MAHPPPFPVIGGNGRACSKG